MKRVVNLMLFTMPKHTVSNLRNEVEQKKVDMSFIRQYTPRELVAMIGDSEDQCSQGWLGWMVEAQRSAYPPT